MSTQHCDRPTLEPRWNAERDPRADEIEDIKQCARGIVAHCIERLQIQNKHDWVLDELIAGIKVVLHDTIGGE